MNLENTLTPPSSHSVETEPSMNQEKTYQGKTFSDCRVLIVDDELSSRLLLSSLLSSEVEDVVTCSSVAGIASVVEMCERIKPDLILMDVNMPGKDGVALCKELKHAPATASIPVIFITASIAPESQENCWLAGADDFIPKPVIASTLTHRVKNVLQRKLQSDLLIELAYKDELTGLYNRHYLNYEVPNLFKQMRQEQKLFALIILDIDYFEGFNHTYGQPAGDTCLQTVADILKRSLPKPHKSIIRHAGEEFLILLPEIDAKQCELIGNKMVQAIADLNIHNPAGLNDQVTVTAGYVVTHLSKEVKLEEVVNKAKFALSDAKQAGRNQLKGCTLSFS